MAKSEPFSVRLPAWLSARIDHEARRTGRSRGAVLARLADEALRCRQFPGVAFRGDDWTRRAWVIGTGLDVWEIVEAFHDFGSPEATIAGSELSRRQLETALAYYAQHPEEIDRSISENRRSVDELRRQYPTAGVHEVEP